MVDSLVETFAERRQFLAAIVLAIAATAITYGSITDHRQTTVLVVVLGVVSILALLFAIVLLQGNDH